MNEEERLARQAAVSILKIMLVKWTIIYLTTRWARKALS